MPESDSDFNYLDLDDDVDDPDYHFSDSYEGVITSSACGNF